MKIALRFSILLNLGLLGWLIVPRVHPVNPVVGAEHYPVPVKPSPTAVAVSLTPSPVSSKAEPFRWNQLYAQDYHVYVKNLRAIGCPEPTLRAIVAADVHGVLQPAAAELEKKLAELANSSWVDQLSARTNAEAWKAELQHLPDEEAAMLADYLGGGGSPDSTPHKRHQAVPDADTPLEAPLVAQPVNLAALNLDSGQLQSISDLQQVFMQKIGGPNQDPSDPAYQARWRTAQAEVDNMMQGMLGNQAYLDYQQQVLANAQAQAAANPQAGKAATSPTASGN